MKMFHRILTETFEHRFFDDFRKVRNGAGSERLTQDSLVVSPIFAKITRNLYVARVPRGSRKKVK